ncbi:hypothetical protein HN371_29325 [Candidatus Poribacteria bacterium]|nr:hypothetical protein [Candidatus Poribacteria bacterium]
MTSPLQIYLFEDTLTPTTLADSGEATGDANPANHHPGKMLQVGESFQIYDAGALQNNNLRVDDGGGAVTLVLTAGGYTADGLAFHVQTLLRTEDIRFNCAYSTTTRKFTIHTAGTFNFTLTWLFNTASQQLATTMGWAQANVGPVATTTADNAEYTHNYNWAVWDLSTSQTVERVMVYATNLASSETIQIYGDDVNWGGLPSEWEAHATIKGAAQTATRSRSNDIYTWGPFGVAVRFIAVFANRGANANQLTQEPFKLGCLGIWEEPSFDGATYGRTIRSQYETRRVFHDTVSESHAGGNWEIGTVRGRRETVFGFGGWTETAYFALDTFFDKHRVKPCLWIADPDNITTDSMLFAAVPPDAGFGSSAKGPNHVRDGTLTLRGIRMQPE